MSYRIVFLCVWEQPTHHFLEQKKFLHLNSENIKFLHANNMWDFSLFIEQDRSDKKYITFSEFVVLPVNQATTVTNDKFVSFCF